MPRQRGSSFFGFRLGQASASYLFSAIAPINAIPTYAIPDLRNTWFGYQMRGFVDRLISKEYISIFGTETTYILQIFYVRRKWNYNDVSVNEITGNKYTANVVWRMKEAANINITLTVTSLSSSSYENLYRYWILPLNALKLVSAYIYIYIYIYIRIMCAHARVNTCMEKNIHI